MNFSGVKQKQQTLLPSFPAFYPTTTLTKAREWTERRPKTAGTSLHFDTRDALSANVRNNNKKIQLTELYNKDIEIPTINYQIKKIQQNYNLEKAIQLVEESTDSDHLMQIENVILAFQYLLKDYPETTYIVQQLIAGLQQYKPSDVLNSKEIEDMLKTAREDDADITIDRSGLARVIAKKQIDMKMCERRVQELRESLHQVDVEIEQNQVILRGLRQQAERYQEELRIRKEFEH